jgi:uncharacterized phage-associated protein
VAQTPVSASSFTDSERRSLEAVQREFRDWSAKRLSAHSHDEEGYKATVSGELISYRYASVLNAWPQS